MSVRIRPMTAADVPAADDIYRDAFTSFLKISREQLGDGQLIRFRQAAYPTSALVAELGGEVVGSIFVAPRGSLSVPGPVTVRPRGWTGNAGALLMQAALAVADRVQKARLVLGYTFPHSPTHIDFHQRVGFWPRFLTAHLAAPVKASPEQAAADTVRLSAQPAPAREALLRGAAEIASAIYEGMDWTSEAEAVAAQDAGDTVLLLEGERPVAFAILHSGPRSEAGTEKAFIKFAGVLPGEAAARRFEALLDGCVACAAALGARQLSLGVNTARAEAYRAVMARGFRATQFGVSMARPDVAAYMQPGVYALDDGR